MGRPDTPLCRSVNGPRSLSVHGVGGIEPRRHRLSWRVWGSVVIFTYQGYFSTRRPEALKSRERQLE